MAVRLGNIEPVNFMLGSKQVEELRIGEQLVWKRRLIEGYDYERYDWLKPINYLNTKKSAFIETKLQPLAEYTAYEVTIKHSKSTSHDTSSGSSSVLGARNEINSNLSTTLLWLLKSRLSYRVDLVYTNAPTDKQYIPYIYDTAVTIKADRIAGTVYVNGVKKASNNNITNIGRPQGPIRLFSTINQGDTNYNFSGYMGNVVFKENNIVIGNYYPCKLSRDIPASLDSQGVSRPAGECGMIDELTGVFYANANTTGSFNVSND